MSKEGYTIKLYSRITDFYASIKNTDYIRYLYSPFQYKNWQVLLYNEFIAQKKLGKYVGIVLYKEQTPVVGGHFFSKRYGKQQGIFFLGAGGETDYNDLCYFQKTVSDDEIDLLIEGLMEYSKQDVFHISQVIKDSPLAKWSEKRAILIKSNTCAKIIIPSSFDEYIKSLSKSTRQNIRTAHNRLSTDNKKCEIKIYGKETISPELVDGLLNVYEQRRIIKNKRLTLIQMVLEIYRKCSKKRYNIIKKAMLQLDNNYLAVVYIESKIAAYLFGLRDYDRQICIMQVAINDEYKRYSPGVLLIVKVVETLIAKGNVRCLDLTNGDEKYKFDLGAEAHLTEYFTYTRSGKNEES